jgi:hypothetical protein
MGIKPTCVEPFHKVCLCAIPDVYTQPFKLFQNRKYFIVPRKHVNSTTKCIYTGLEGQMIPQHLLKHATLKSVNIFDGIIMLKVQKKETQSINVL